MAHILIADDDRTTRTILRACLSTAGYTVEEAQDGNQALAICTHNPPDMLVTNQIMPGLTGLALIKRFHPRIRCILISADNKLRNQATQLGVPFLLKPVECDDLRNAIQKTMGHP
jgi:Response regulator containing CheY-like receiver, AAA-type ATPase, and DNA-binding domains